MFLRILTIFIATFILAACSESKNEYQSDADIIRLRHLKHYGELIESYHEKAGKYPFQGKENVPIYVYVANDQQHRFTEKGPKHPHKVISFSKFVKEVESVLGREIKEFYEPEDRFKSKPCFYIYAINKETYFFAVHLNSQLPFTREIGKNYFKVEISNNPDKENHAHSLKGLLNSEVFQDELYKPVKKEGYFQEREDKYIDHSKKSEVMRRM